MTDKKDLEVGAFYWVQITLDPDAEEAWENDVMPARFAGTNETGGLMWNFLGQEGTSDWYVKWVGDKLTWTPR